MQDVQEPLSGHSLQVHHRKTSFLLQREDCKRSVASAHLALHEAHCLLFLVLCPECKEAVPQEKMDEHCRGGHQQVGCAMCQQSLPKHSLEVHEATECQERPVECKFCELAVRLSKGSCMSTTVAGGRSSAPAAASSSCSMCWPSTEMCVGASRPGSRKVSSTGRGGEWSLSWTGWPGM
ncbi:XIAP-associated factor 1 [Camelus dromedarius]|uniref:XIAP-associated factor 1 n=1 Tax=Camelus dromedarius TaxID=9838 RepID=A0A5N4D3W2_CAMDR|nr:XIAP-associated factor 1 [Camelus dromedarius]